MVTKNRFDESPAFRGSADWSHSRNSSRVWMPPPTKGQRPLSSPRPVSAVVSMQKVTVTGYTYAQHPEDASHLTLKD
ncbi:hypothetical protein AAFF_G00332070 [Aldrovandia affinis]|uniref:Uncharacterized protein n=1 Tax=Aldrovandia affinis TaxID=143900 RepID=A0AAD7WQ25_9TELE|nr:hypothetical protein AAFF_G00332070 [Aldrovandia affinis]